MLSVGFFIIGVQKGGTTALDRYLRRNPFVQMAGVKEVHFFDNDSLDWIHPDYRQFHQHFRKPQSSAIIYGEATPISIYWPNVLQRLHRYNARSKLIVCLRHPSYRAHSHWRMEVKRSAETWSFEDAISEAGRSRVWGTKGGAHRVYSYVERGFYAPQICRLQKLFPPEQLLFIRTDDLWTNMEDTLVRICTFLNIDIPSDFGKRGYIVPMSTREIGTISAASLEKLNTLYEADIRETSGLTGLALGDWMQPDYQEPMMAS